jgi:hypothetical protein
LFYEVIFYKLYNKINLRAVKLIKRNFEHLVNNGGSLVMKILFTKLKQQNRRDVYFKYILEETFLKYEKFNENESAKIQQI